MTVCTVDIDGVLADTEDEVIVRMLHHFNVPFEEANWDYEDFYSVIPGMSRHNINDFLYSSLCFDDPKLWYEAVPIKRNIDAVAEYAFAGNTITLVTARDPKFLAITELWLSRNRVPYSSLLLGVLDKAKMMYHLGSEFIIEDSYTNARECADDGFRAYVVRAKYNAKRENENPFGVGWVDYAHGAFEHEGLILKKT